MNVNKNLTPKQKRLFDFLGAYLAKYGTSPSFKEISEELGLKSNGSVAQYVDALEEKGYLTRETGSRQIYLTRASRDEELAEVLLLGTIAAGLPIEPVENPEPITVPKSMLPQTGTCYALKISGDSMIEDGIWDDDVILVKHQREASPGDIIVAITEDGATLKRYCVRDDGRPYLQPRNKDLKPMFPDFIEVRGKFLGLIRHGEEPAN